MFVSTILFTHAELRISLNCILIAVPNLGDALFVFVFFLFLFSMIGIQFFSDQFQNRCVAADGSVVGGSSTILNGPLCAVADVAYFGLHSNLCGNQTQCLSVASNPLAGAVSFDNILAAMLTNFVCITGEGWSSVMYTATDVTNDAFTIYFLLMMIIQYMFMTQVRLRVGCGVHDCRQG